LIFQEGKNIEGEFYIIAVYDDPASSTISFCAYELENDCTYTYPLSYSEFDSLFRFDSELINPSNVDGRFHWVIERLDFVQDHTGTKVLSLANQPTPEADDDEEDEEEIIAEQPKAQGVQPAGAGGGRVDAQTRARLLKELDTHDDEKLHKGLVRSEAARKKFLKELLQKRQLEQLKAQQRLQKTDEEREARMAKLDVIKQQQQAKAQAHREKEEAQKSTMAQLEALMKQKEAQAIRRLIQQKDEQDRGMGREKNAARERRKAQERSAAEVAAIENQRAQQLARNREQQVLKREQLVKNKDRQEADKVRERREAERFVQVRRREEKDAIIEELWRQKKEERLDREARRDEFERLEELRDKANADRDKRRAKDEHERWKEMHDAEVAEKEETDTRRRKEHQEYLLQWKVDASKRAVAVRDNQKRMAMREAKLREKEENRLRKFRESQFLETMRGSMSPKGDEEPASPSATTPGGTMKHAAKTVEAEERAKRASEREQKKKQEEAKKAKVEKLGATNPNASEILRAREWRIAEEKRKQAVEQARLARELADEKAAKDATERSAKREEKFEYLEGVRREASVEREHKRNEAVVFRTKNIPFGTGLPIALVY